MEGYCYFASPIYREERPEWVSDTLKHTQKYYEQSKEWMPEGAAVIQTSHMAEDPDLKYLTSYFRDKSVGILRDQGYTTDEYEFYLSGMWGQSFSRAGSNIMHVHGDSQISGFYFLETSEQGSYPIFDDPRPGKKMMDLTSSPSDQVTMATPQIHFNNVMSGTMMFFNSWLPHMITGNQSEKPTTFIHFILSHRKRFI